MVEERVWPAITTGSGKKIHLMERRCISSLLCGSLESRELDVHFSRVECPGARGCSLEELVGRGTQKEESGDQVDLSGDSERSLMGEEGSEVDHFSSKSHVTTSATSVHDQDDDIQVSLK